MKKVFLLLLIAGLMAGPAYWVQAKFLTGSRVALLDLRQGPEGTWRTAVFNLAPDMAAVGLILHLQASSPLVVTVSDQQVKVTSASGEVLRQAQAAAPGNPLDKLDVPQALAWIDANKSRPPIPSQRTARGHVDRSVTTPRRGG